MYSRGAIWRRLEDIVYYSPLQVLPECVAL